MLYPLAIRQNDHQFVGVLPDFPELTIIAENITDVISQARLTVMTHLLTLYHQGKPLPNGSDISDHLSAQAASKSFLGATWAIISIDAARIKGKKVKLTIELPEPLLTCARHHISALASFDCASPSSSHDLNELIVKALQAYLPSYSQT